METSVLALDFGASGARAMRAVTSGETLTVTELHRWENVPITIDGRLHWDMDALFREVRVSLCLAAKAGGVDAIGIDTWGVDFGLIGADGRLIEPPVHYRDTRTAGILNRVPEHISTDRLYELTGIQLMEINTAFQLLALREQRPALLEQAQTLLLMPDLFAYLLTGEVGAEYSIASTTGLLDCRTRTWSDEVCAALGIPQRILPPVSASGTVRGTLLPALCAECGLLPVPVIAVAGHDTASAVVAAPRDDVNAAFLSCGTWSLLGTVLDAPVLTPTAQRGAMTNEGGFGGAITLLTNLTGLWLVQESRRQWQREGHTLSFATLEEQATASQTAARIDTQAADLALPGNLPARIRAQCAICGGAIPQTPGDVVRCIYESLADTYARGLQELCACTGRTIDTISLLGGGARGALLPQLTADRTGCTVFAGPVEATVLGNIAVQLVALGASDSLQDARKLLETQETIRIYYPNRKV